MNLVRALIDMGHSIVFAATADSSDKNDDLSRLGIRVERVYPNDPQFDSLLEELSPELVVFDRFMAEEQFGWRVYEKCPDALRILNTQDLHGLREARYQALQTGCDMQEPEWNNEVALREIAAIYRSDASLIISKWEMDWLKEELEGR